MKSHLTHAENDPFDPMTYDPSTAVGSVDVKNYCSF